MILHTPVTASALVRFRVWFLAWPPRLKIYLVAAWPEKVTRLCSPDTQSVLQKYHHSQTATIDYCILCHFKKSCSWHRGLKLLHLQTLKAS